MVNKRATYNNIKIQEKMIQLKNNNKGESNQDEKILPSNTNEEDFG